MPSPSPTSGRLATAGMRRTRWATITELALPLLLIAGLVVPDDDVWTESLEIALLPMFLWYVVRYGLGGRRAALAVSIPLAWIVWLGLSGGWGVPEARAAWDHESMAALQTGVFYLLCATYVRVTPVAALERAGIGLVLASYAGLLTGLLLDLATTGSALDGRLEGVGLFVNPNRAGAICTLTALFAIFLANRTLGSLRITMLAYPPLALIYIVLTGSRSGFLVFSIALFIYFLISNGRDAARRTILTAAGFALLFTAAIAVTPGLPDFLTEQISRNVYRLQIWAESWELAQDRILLGYGLGYDEPILDRFKHPHDMHLANLLYGGLPALVLGMLTLAVSAIMAFRLPDGSCRALAVSSVVLVVLWTIPNGGVPISKPNDDWYHFWIPIALTAGLTLRSRAAPRGRG